MTAILYRSCQKLPDSTSAGQNRSTVGRQSRRDVAQISPVWSKEYGDQDSRRSGQGLTLDSAGTEVYVAMPIKADAVLRDESKMAAATTMG